MPNLCYQAGPFFNPEQRSYYEAVTTCAENHIKVFSVVRDGVVVKPHDPEDVQLRAFNLNIDRIREASLVVAVLDYLGVELCTGVPAKSVSLPDLGVVWEIGAAYILGVPIIGIITPKSSLNLMIAKSLVAVTESLDQLDEVLSKLVPVLDNQVAYAEVLLDLKCQYSWKLGIA